MSLLTTGVRGSACRPLGAQGEERELGCSRCGERRGEITEKSIPGVLRPRDVPESAEQGQAAWG